jgi:hypothetical protein
MNWVDYIYRWKCYTVFADDSSLWFSRDGFWAACPESCENPSQEGAVIRSGNAGQALMERCIRAESAENV